MGYRLTIEDTSDYSMSEVGGIRKVTLDTSNIDLPGLLEDIRNLLRGVGFEISGELDITNEEE